MGYCIDQISSEFHIKAEHTSAALAAIKALSKETHLGWVDANEVEAATTLLEAGRAVNWEFIEETDGEIADITFRGTKSSDEETVLQALAPFVEHDSYIQMRGEGGEMWRFVFRAGKLFTQEAVITWVCPDEGFKRVIAPFQSFYDYEDSFVHRVGAFPDAEGQPVEGAFGIACTGESMTREEAVGLDDSPVTCFKCLASEP